MVKHLIETDKKKNIMRPTISHNIKLVTENVAVFPAEKEAWTKTMIRAANLKIKITRKTTKLLLLQKLREKAFRFSVARTFRSPLVRQIYEAVKIYGSQADIVLNNKSEWNQPAIDRIIVTREV